MHSDWLKLDTLLGTSNHITLYPSGVITFILNYCMRLPQGGEKLSFCFIFRVGKILSVTTWASTNASSSYQRLLEGQAKATTGPLTRPRSTCSRKARLDEGQEDSEERLSRTTVRQVDVLFGPWCLLNISLRPTYLVQAHAKFMYLGLWKCCCMAYGLDPVGPD